MVGGAAVAAWEVRATSADGLSRQTTLAASARSVVLRDLPGRRTWTVTVRGRGDLGDGPATTGPAVAVGDTTGAPAVTALALAPSYDTTLVSWVVPPVPDVHHVLVTGRPSGRRR